MGVRLYKHARKSPTKTAQFWWDLLFRQLVLSAGVQNYFLDLFFSTCDTHKYPYPLFLKE